jgi:hypothetical protein
MTPYVIAAIVSAAAAWTVQDWRYQGRVSQLKSDHAQALAEQIASNGKRLARLADQQHTQVQTHIQFVAREHARIKTITEQIATIIDRPVYRDNCVDDDGLRLIAQAIAGTDDRAPTVPHTGPTVPAAHPSK